MEKEGFYEEVETVFDTIERDSFVPDYESWFYEKVAGKVISNLEKKHIKALYVSDRGKAFSRIMEMIPEGATVGFGDSVTLYQLGIISELQKGKYNFINPWVKGISFEESLDLRRKALTADIFLSGTNALTLDGKLVNIDGLGNRVAGIVFGPKKVIIAVGANKVVRNVEDGLKRVKEIAAPINYKRHNFKLPCVETGICSECNSPWRGCSKIVIIDGDLSSKFFKEPRITVVIIGETLGF